MGGRGEEYEINFKKRKQWKKKRNELLQSGMKLFPKLKKVLVKDVAQSMGYAMLLTGICPGYMIVRMVVHIPRGWCKRYQTKV